jgi:hypothetical protein
MAVADYSKRLLWMGSGQVVDKRCSCISVRQEKTVSPKSISSLSYAFSCCSTVGRTGLAVPCLPCQEMGTDKISSAEKLLFSGVGFEE